MKKESVSAEDLLNVSLPYTHDRGCSSVVSAFDPERGVIKCETNCGRGDYAQMVIFTGKDGNYESLLRALGFVEQKEEPKEIETPEEELEEIPEEVESEEEPEKEEPEEKKAQQVKPVLILHPSYEELMEALGSRTDLTPDVKVHCECPDFNFKGYAYKSITHQYGIPALIPPPARRAPNPSGRNNPTLAGSICKHLVSALTVLLSE